MRKIRHPRNSTREKNYALLRAAAKGDIDGVRNALAEGANIRTQDGLVVSRAIYGGNVEVIRFLLDAGLESHMITKQLNPTVVMVISRHPQRVAIVANLLDAGAHDHFLPVDSQVQAYREAKAIRVKIKEKGRGAAGETEPQGIGL